MKQVAVSDFKVFNRKSRLTHIIWQVITLIKIQNSFSMMYFQCGFTLTHRVAITFLPQTSWHTIWKSLCSATTIARSFMSSPYRHNHDQLQIGFSWLWLSSLNRRRLNFLRNRLCTVIETWKRKKKKKKENFFVCFCLSKTEYLSPEKKQLNNMKDQALIF